MKQTIEQLPLQQEIADVLKQLGIKEHNAAYSTGLNWGGQQNSTTRDIYSPADGNLIASVNMATPEDYEQVVTTAQEAFKVWRKTPAPKRGEIVRQIGDKLRQHKEALGKLVSYEM
ncbi:MAG TPA: aldehyde dehydrogenase family protein, partial [Pontibacter sp.]